MKIDDLNISIVRHLREGRKSYKVIAEDLGVSENTIRSRVSKLEEEGVLDIVGLVDPETIPRHRVVMVGVKLSTMDLVKKGAEFSRVRGGGIGQCGHRPL
jgi:Lrp/AsnC family transcriptional regulator for asnA, asnC and gidA